jgi:hypothetical protein
VDVFVVVVMLPGVEEASPSDHGVVGEIKKRKAETQCRPTTVEGRIEGKYEQVEGKRL